MPELRTSSPLSSIRVLAVGCEEAFVRSTGLNFGEAGHALEEVPSFESAIERFRSDSYDLVLCSLGKEGADGERLVQWLGSYRPSIRVILRCAEVEGALGRRYAFVPNVRVVAESIDSSDLLALVEELGARKGFYGTSIEVELFDYVQMVALSGRDKLIVVDTPLGEGKVWFEHGDIVHAEYESKRGESAFYRLLAVGRGAFHEVMFEQPPLRTIVTSSTHLLIEAARMMDEGILGVDSDTGASEVEAVDGEKEDESSFADIAAEMELDEGAADEEEKEVEAAKGAGHDGDEGSNAALEIWEDPEMRALMLGQFFEYEGVNGVAIVSSTGKVLAEDVRGNTSLVTLAGFYMRGAARIARSLGYNVFDGVIAKAETGLQVLMVGMGASSVVLSIDEGSDPEVVRLEVMGVDR